MLLLYYINVNQSHKSPSSTEPKSNGMTSPTRSLSSSLLSSARSLSLRGSLIGQGEGHHSLMAPHEGETSLCQDDLHNLFELAEMLFKVNASCLMHTRGLDVVSLALPTVSLSVGAELVGCGLTGK